MFTETLFKSILVVITTVAWYTVTIKKILFNFFSDSSEKASNELKRKLEEIESSKEEELLSWKRRVRDLEHDNQTLQDDVRS